MELGSSRVWDYAGDNYVHRLVQNKADGKLVEVDEQSAGEQEEKIDALNLEVIIIVIWRFLVCILQSNQLKWTALGSNYEYSLR